jgi:hypothetical protein
MSELRMLSGRERFPFLFARRPNTVLHEILEDAAPPRTRKRSSVVPDKSGRHGAFLCDDTQHDTLVELANSAADQRNWGFRLILQIAEPDCGYRDA